MLFRSGGREGGGSTPHSSVNQDDVAAEPEQCRCVSASVRRWPSLLALLLPSDHYEDHLVYWLVPELHTDDS